MSDTTSQSRKLKLGTMTVIITLEGDAYPVRARKATPLTDEDYIQQQILEHQLRYYGLQPRVRWVGMKSGPNRSGRAR